MLEMSNKIKDLQYKLAKSYSDVMTVIRINGRFRDEPKEAIAELNEFNKSEGEKLSDVSKMLGNVSERSRSIEIGLKILSSIVTSYADVLTAVNVELLNEVKYNTTSIDANLKELLSNINIEVQTGNLGKILVSLATKEYATKRLPIVIEQYLIGKSDVKGYLYGLTLLLSKHSTCSIDALNKAYSLYNKKELFVKNEISYITKSETINTTDVTLVSSKIDSSKTLETDLNKYIIDASTSEKELDLLSMVVKEDLASVEVMNTCASDVKDTLDKIVDVSNVGLNIILSDVKKLSNDLANSVITDKEYNKYITQYDDLFKSSINNYTELLDMVDQVSVDITLSSHITNTVYDVCNDVLINITVG